MINTSETLARLISENRRDYYCFLNINAMNINSHYREPILYYMDPQKLHDAVINTADKHYFARCLMNRYADHGHLTDLAPERFSLRELKRLLEKTINEEKNVLLSLQIEKLVSESLEPCIDRLTACLNNPECRTVY